MAELKEKWRNLVKRGKKDWAEERKSVTETGGGPPKQMDATSIYTSEIISLMKGTPSFSGIPGATDAETFIDLDKLLCQDIPDELNVLTDLHEDSLTGPLTDKNNKETEKTETYLSSSELSDEGKNSTENERTTDIRDNGKKLGHIEEDEPVVKEKKSGKKRVKTLKELQIEYYSKALEVQAAQIECFNKVSSLADVLINKFSNQ